MNVAVTGATGFVGSHLTARLLMSGHTVVALSRDTPDRAMARLATALEATGAPPELLSSLADRLRPVTIRLGEPHLGMPQEDFRRLGDELKAIWHCAGVTGLEADRALLRHVNVQGTCGVLSLAAAGARPSRVFHVSTAYVAGGRRHGVVGEEDLSDAHGFLCPYEESKYIAEEAVRAWAAQRQDHRVTVFRPSVLVTDRPLSRRAPRHPHAVLGARLAVLSLRGPGPFLRRFGPDTAHGVHGSMTVRMRGRDDAVLNVLPIEYAADAMVRLAGMPQERPVRTFHVVHPVDTPVRTLLDVMERMVPWLRTMLVEARSDPSPAELYLEALSGGVSHYAGLTRRYSRGGLAEADAAHGVAPPVPLSSGYLLATMRGSLSSPTASSVSRRPAGGCPPSRDHGEIS